MEVFIDFFKRVYYAFGGNEDFIKYRRRTLRKKIQVSKERNAKLRSKLKEKNLNLLDQK